MSDSEFRPGLEGVVAVETEIAEPDREGGALRYRGVDIEELVGRVAVREGLGTARRRELRARACPSRSRTSLSISPGTRPPTLRPRLARLSGVWGLGKLTEIDDEQARDDLARLSAQVMAIVARSARAADGNAEPISGRRRRRRCDRRREVPPPLARRGGSGSRHRHRHVLDLHRRARPQRVDVHRSDSRVDGRRRRGRACRPRSGRSPARCTAARPRT